MNGNLLIPFVVSREPAEGSNHEQNRIIQRLLNGVTMDRRSTKPVLILFFLAKGIWGDSGRGPHK